MMSWPLAILSASLLGSVHCAGMCGGFVCLYAGAGDTTGGSSRAMRAWLGHTLYNLGRLTSYLLLGAAAGALGAGVTQIGAHAGITRIAALVSGVLMIAWGAHALAVQRGVRVGRANAPAAWQRVIGGLLRRVRQQPPAVRAWWTGLATTLLPCGWLYVFVAAAGGTGHVLTAMALMAVFWLGTLPAMVMLGVGIQHLFGPLRRYLPTVSAATVLVMGMLSLAGRLQMTMPMAVPSTALHAVQMPALPGHQHGAPLP